MKLAPEGAPWIRTLLALGAAAAFFSPAAAGIFWTAAAGTALFFRDPDRTAAAPEEAVLSPADGTIREIGPVENPADFGLPRGADSTPGGPAFHRVSIHLSLWDVHVNRLPVSGKVTGRFYRPGRFLPAFLPAAGRQNESNLLVLEHPAGTVMVRQVAGCFARRIVCRLAEGDAGRRGQRLGMIRFGSRVDLYLPPSVRLSVRPGQRVRAGVTVIGTFPPRAE